MTRFRGLIELQQMRIKIVSDASEELHRLQRGPHDHQHHCGQVRLHLPRQEPAGHQVRLLVPLAQLVFNALPDSDRSWFHRFARKKPDSVLRLSRIVSGVDVLVADEEELPDQHSYCPEPRLVRLRLR